MTKYMICFLDDLTESDFKAVFNAMDASRQKKVLRLQKNEDKKRTLAGEFLVKKMIGEQLDCPMEAILLTSDEKGKPVLNNLNLHCSISHSEQMVAAAISDAPIGIDAEQIHEVPIKLAKRVCTEAELRFVFGYMPQEDGFEKTPSYDCLARFFEIWTKKEAYFKYMGTGITEFKKIDVLSLPFETFIKDGYCISVFK